MLLFLRQRKVFFLKFVKYFFFNLTKNNIFLFLSVSAESQLVFRYGRQPDLYPVSVERLAQPPAYRTVHAGPLLPEATRR